MAEMCKLLGYSERVHIIGIIKIPDFQRLLIDLCFEGRIEYMKRQLFFIFIATLLMVSLAAGCAPQQRPAPGNTPAPQQRNEQLPNTSEGPGNRVPNAEPQEDSRRADKLADRIEDLDNIEDATVIISGSTAYVGVDMDENLQGRMTDALKERVIDRAKKTDMMLNRVYVSADSDTVTRLKNYAKDIEDGKPISGIIQQIDEIFRRPAPTVK
jgi:YhcN/YlaJ family sporulation lipoprotein